MTLDERIEQLMQPGCDYDPLRPDNLAESLANLTLVQINKLSEWLLNAKRIELAYTVAGQSIAICSYEHWKKLATTQAQADIDREQDEACPKCGGNEGKGCTACDVKLRREQRGEE